MDQELLRARYATFAALALVFGIYLIVALPWHALLSVAVALVTSALLTAVLEFWLRLSLRRAALRSSPAEQADMSQVQAMLAFQKKVLGAFSERDVLEAVLETGCGLLSANGASFLPYDEFGKTLPTLMHGKVPVSALENWSNRLASPETRQICKACKAMHGKPGCVLLPEETSKPAAEVLCFPIHSAGREVGIVNYFFEQPVELTGEQSGFMVSLLDFAGQAVETLRLREQEMTALRYLQTATGPKSDISDLFSDLLENVQKALDTDFALLYIPGGIKAGIASTPMLLAKTRQDSVTPVATPDLTFLEGIWKSVLASGQSISLENVTLNRREMWKVFLAVPLLWQDSTPAGILVLGANNIQTFAERQRALLETIAAQAALLLQNARLMVQLEYQAVVDERTRLAREIHDGLAQTLAFLKIQAAQMQNYLSRGETERLTSTLQASYRTLSDAYLDARQAIDNLRRVPTSSLRDWLGEVLTDFRESAGISAELEVFDLSGEFPPTVQAQLIRIVQEALSNVRKHSRASQVKVRVHEHDGFILFDVHDNGVGFLLETLEVSSRYGLRGVRERSEMLGADFQVSSQPGQGTLVSLRLPASLKESV